MKCHASAGVVLWCAFCLSTFSAAQNTPQLASDSSRISEDTPEVRYSEIEIENPDKFPASAALIQQIFRQTVREVARQLNPNHPPTVRAKVTLRLDEQGFDLETTKVAGVRHSIIRMQKWNELTFARLVARAVRHALFSDEELDKLAEAALKRVHATTSVTELKQRR